MPPPRKRLVVKKDKIYTEFIPRQITKSVQLADSSKKNRILKFLARKASRKHGSKKLKLLRLRRPFTKKPKGHSYRFRRIETLVKNKHSSMKHWNITTTRGNSKRYTSFMANRMTVEKAPILLIVRIHGKKNVPPQVLSMLEQLRLSRPFFAIIARNTPELQYYLQYLDNYVTYGVPSKECVRDLVLKRGKILAEGLEGPAGVRNVGNGEKDDLQDLQHKNRRVLKSNVLVEKILGAKYGMICIEDIIDVLTSDPNRFGNILEETKLNELETKLLKNSVVEKKNFDIKSNMKSNMKKSELKEYENKKKLELEEEDQRQALQLADANRTRLQAIMAANLRESSADSEEIGMDANENENDSQDAIETNNEANEQTEAIANDEDIGMDGNNEDAGMREKVEKVFEKIAETETIFDEVEMKREEARKKFDDICNYINPFELNLMKIPMRGLTGPFDHKGYYGYRGEHINKFVEKLI